MPKCQVCEKNFINLSSHINAKHNLNKKEYIARYPGAAIIDTDLSKTFAANSKKMHAMLKEKDPTDYTKTRKEICKNMREIKGDNFKHSAETREKMRQSHIGLTRNPHTQETKNKLSIAKLGRPINLTASSKHEKTLKQKMRWQERKLSTIEFANYIAALSSRRKEYILAHGITIPKKGTKTSIEKRFEEFLLENKIRYEFQYFLLGKYYDFYLPDLNLLVEVDGEYWHRMQHAIKNDLEKHTIARDQNFKILRLTERAWNIDLIYETDYSIIQNHNFNILNKRTVECLSYELSTSMI